MSIAALTSYIYNGDKYVLLIMIFYRKLKALRRKEELSTTAQEKDEESVLEAFLKSLSSELAIVTEECWIEPNRLKVKELLGTGTKLS